MLTRFLYLSTIWFALSLIFTLAAGSRLRRGDFTFSMLWLAAIIFMGNIIALVTFGNALEVFVLSWFAFAFGLFWITRLSDWNAPGQVTWSMTLMTTGLFIVYTFMLTAFTPLNPLSFIFALVFFFLEVITLMLALAHMHESLDVICRIQWHRRVEKPEPVTDYAPMVSLHVPAYNEPVEIVQQTLESLSRLNYPNFEVLVLDNNTPLEETWRPLEEICRRLGTRFHCLHLDKWPGYKSGALNFALTQTDPSVEIISIIDADYIVDPNFLVELVPAFSNPQMAFVQTPQDYRDATSGIFSQSTYRGYKYFFEVSMPSRNERNAIIFAGTMGLIRKPVLEEIGGWDEWCITEDAEASLRILKRGYQSLYINKAYGSGLMPFNFEGLKKQRFRWCFGGIQLLKKHWEALMPWGHWVDPNNKLTLSQRYYYLVGGLGWFSDVFNLLFALFLVLGAIFSIFSSSVQIRPLTDTILILPAIFLGLHILRFLWVLRNRLKISLGMAVATMYNFFSLGWAVTLACIQGLVQKQGVFLRTPKSKTSSKTWHAIHVTQWETTIGLLCLLAGVLSYAANPNWRTLSLCLLLFWQGSLYLAGPLFSLLSLGGEKSQATQITEQGSPIPEQRAAGWVLVISMVLIAAFSLIKILPSPTQLPGYARYLPSDISLRPTVPAPAALRPGQTALPSTTSATATVSVQSANCRKKPRGGAEKVAVFYQGQQLAIVGRNSDFTNPWWYVKVPASDNYCWLWGQTTTTSGPVDQLPVTE